MMSCVGLDEAQMEDKVVKGYHPKEYSLEMNQKSTL